MEDFFTKDEIVPSLDKQRVLEVAQQIVASRLNAMMKIK